MKNEYSLKPITLKKAQEFVREHHRHNSIPQGHKFSIGIEKDCELVGCCIVGRPVSRNLDDGYTAEITRVCVIEGMMNANSMLYAAAARACKAMGFQKVITYTLNEESGSSLKAVGFVIDGTCKGRKKGWDTPARRRDQMEKYPYGDKIRWKITFEKNRRNEAS